MASRTNLLIFLFFALVVNFNSQVIEKTSPIQIEDSSAAAAAVKELYNLRDYESGYELGRQLVKKFPGNFELQAWFIVNMARNNMSGNAVEAAKKLVEDNKENAWAQFALANAYIRNAQVKEATAAGEKALMLNPSDEEFIFLYTSALLMPRKYEEIYAFLDKNSSRIKDQSRLAVVRAEAQYRHSLLQNAEAEYGKNYQKKFKNLAFENFAKAVRLDANSVNANFIYGVYLNYDKRFAESLPLLKKAVALSPQVAHIRQQYWQVVLKGQPDKNEARRKAEVISDIDSFLRLRPDSAGALETAATFYQTELAMPDKKKEFDAIILKKFPQSVQAEKILIDRIKSFDYYDENKKVDEKKRAQLVQTLKDFVQRENHFDKPFLEQIYSKLYYEIKSDKKTTDAELLELAGQISKSAQSDLDETYSMIAFGLTDRKMFREAEKFINTGFEKIKKEIEEQRVYIQDENEIEKNSNKMNAVLHNALGRTYFKENRLDDAEREYRQAIKLNGGITYFYNSLGQVYEAKNELEKAENAYIRAFSGYYGKDNPNVAALKSLYEKRGGSLEGSEDYFKKIEETAGILRKERVLAAKIKDAKSVSPFTLKNLEGKPILFADLRGKIVVVNIWGTWCGPCVQEMPEFQELHKKYLNDKDVAILTINNDEDLETVKKFMVAKKYDFAVLRDENYLQKVDITEFPTTWFIDRDGKISYVQVGGNGKLLEEFGWRIEELKK